MPTAVHSDMPDTKRFLLEKVTLNYVASEDRICMNAQIRGGEAVTFWLTQRLCRGLVKTFVDYLDKTTVPSTDTGKSMVQNHFQQEAMIRKIRSPSVDASKSSTAPMLVKTLNIRTGSDSLLLRLPMPDGSVSALPLKSVEARQLLQILFVQYRKGDWPLDIWPQWIRKPGVEGKLVEGVVH